VPKGSKPDSPRAADTSEWVNLTLSDSRAAVQAMVHRLHRHHIIAASDWSQEVAVKSTTTVLRVAARGIRT
jgi:hypothetical protein